MDKRSPSCVKNVHGIVHNPVEHHPLSPHIHPPAHLPVMLLLKTMPVLNTPASSYPLAFPQRVYRHLYDTGSGIINTFHKVYYYNYYLYITGKEHV